MLVNNTQRKKSKNLEPYKLDDKYFSTNNPNSEVRKKINLIYALL